ncbi:MAG: MMPL family transporter [Pirellulales bacterium]
MVRHRLWLLVVAAAIAAWAVVSAPRVEFDRSLENMFAADDPVLPPFRRLKRTFHAGDVVLAAYADDQLFSVDGLNRSERVAKEIEAIAGVDTVVGPHSSFLKPAILLPKNPWSERLIETFAGFTHSRDGRTAALICVLADDADHTATVTAIRDIVERQPLGVIAGEPVMIVDGFRYLEEDGRRLGWITTALLALVIVICFRSLRWVVVPLSVVVWTRLVTEALLVAVGLRMSIVSSMLAAIVTVVAVAATMHVIVRFRQARAGGRSATGAMRQTIALLAVPVFWACATDAIGFASLLISDVAPVRDFGLMTAVGALVVLLALVLLAPGLALFGRWDIDPHRVWGESHLDDGLARSLRLVERYPRGIATASSIVIAVLGFGMLLLQVETDFTRNFRRDSPIAQSYDFIESRLGGAGVWDIVLPAPEKLDAAYLDRVRKLQARLRGPEFANGPPTGVLSLVDILDGVTNDGLRKVPQSLHDFVFARGINAIGSKSSLVRSFYNTDPANTDPAAPQRHYYRIMLRAEERKESSEKQILIDDVVRICQEEFPQAFDSAADLGSTPQSTAVTGYYVLLTRLIHSILADQWRMFALASAGIALAIAVAFRSLRMAVAAMVANLMPVAVALGIWGWLGLKVNIGTAMIAAVSMGLSVDSSIHYLAEFRRRRRVGHSVSASLRAAHQAAGRAMSFATLALVVGFAALLPSEFVPTIYFGSLVALALVGSLVGNLILLPLLLKWLFRDPIA